MINVCSYASLVHYIGCSISVSVVAFLLQIPAFSGFPDFPNGDYPMIPIMYPAIVPGLASLQNQEQMSHGEGIYAVPVLPFVGHVSGLPSNTLIPLTYNMPTRK